MSSDAVIIERAGGEIVKALDRLTDVIEASTAQVGYVAESLGEVTSELHKVAREVGLLELTLKHIDR